MAPRNRLPRKPLCPAVNSPQGCDGTDCPLSHRHRGEQCRAFAEGRKCRFGGKCVYLHGQSGQDTPQAPNTVSTSHRNMDESSLHGQVKGGGDADTTPPHDGHQEQDDLLLQRWRFSTSEASDPDKPLSQRARSKFFQQAYELIQSDIGIMQAVIKALAQSGGIQRVLQLVKDNHTAPDKSTSEDTFRTTILPFFKTIGHPKALASSLLDSSLAKIYHTLYGPDGRYVIRLFEFVTSLSEPWSMEDLEATLAVFSKTLATNDITSVKEKFKLILTALETRMGSIRVEASLSKMAMQKWLDSTKSLLGLDRPGHNTRPLTHNFKSGNVADHEDIRQIRILPTFEEIISSSKPYLPVLDPRSLHLPGIAGLVDRQFRLYREDMVGPIRDAIRIEIERQTNPNSRPTHANRSQRTNLYTGVRFEQLYCDARQGLLIIISVDQPRHLAQTSFMKRRGWWEVTKRLKRDALVSILDPNGHVLFGTVSEIEPDEKRGKDRERAEKDEASELAVNANDLFKDANRAVLAIAPAEEDDINRIFEYFTLLTDSKNFTLLEFPGVLLPAFQHTLRALQDMIRTQDLPFAELLAPEPVISAQLDIEPPAYAQQDGFHFDLTCLLSDGGDMRLSPKRPFDTGDLIKKSTLDDKQAESIVHLLSRCFALCQGPPGTGKSYTAVQLIRVLLANKKAAQLGPILVVTYTNHALDQIGEHLIDNGVTRLVRIGSQSKSEQMADRNLRVVEKTRERTEVERQEFGKCYRGLRNAAEYLNSAISEFDSGGSAESLKTHLQWNYHEHYDAFWDFETGVKTPRLSSEEMIQMWLNKPPELPAQRSQNRSVETLIATEAKTWEMSLPERRALHRFWLQECQKDRSETFRLAVAEYKNAKKEDSNAKGEVDQRCLEEADVIAITTSGLARNLNLLRRLPIKVLLIEEAGEVLEAHTLTALLPSVEHAILIGDHLQLKPQVNNYDLSSENHHGKKYSLDISLFERLVNKRSGIPGVQLPFSTLETQRRMHPSISALIRSSLYPSLQDAPNVSSYPEVAGLRKRLFWLDHSKPEVGDDTDEMVATSKSNDHEVEICASLVSHILKQGSYQPQDIALITPYLGQLFKLKKRLARQFEVVLGDRDVDALENAGIVQHGPPERAQKESLLNALKVATIDNFQGEEAKVVVVSLVRSNKHRNCGFLKTSNRINVLLSRAMHGMYIVGNSATSATVPMWAQVIDMFKNDNNIGTALPLCCARHPDTVIEASEPAHFLRFCPEGGCDLPCEKPLSCGHICPRKCHSEHQHLNVICQEKCLRTKPGCSHVCSKLCGEQCDARCEEPVRDKNIVLGCGHAIKNPKCWQYQARDSLKCTVPVKRRIESCRHQVTAQCHVEINSKDFKCPVCRGTW